ncbi:ABC transporter substrate-binding protein [Microterricola pindariensis]|uniref:Glycine/betaine ABC transporter n=1 Tax=Microterricola pindariensis TaxID=478010 RepID=A0ABX5ARV7_9MICO|nr:ABC transporter substrate-binding protein [Microterricola pindariensis]PPL15082.1 glycine/betaine ABC transporter [Microterricola pindariensis]
MNLSTSSHSSPSTRRGLRVAAAGAAALLALALGGCASGDPLNPAAPSDTGTAASETIVVGSQQYYSNEIIAEIYAQALEANGFTVKRTFNIGQRDAYLPALESGEVDLFPEYTGNLLQYYAPDTTARTTDDVYAALGDALPSGLRVLDQADATDQDSYVVTKSFADANSLVEIGDLAQVTTPITLGGNSELATRPYGPEGLKSVYGVTVGFTPIEDSGGPLTQKALLDGTVQLVNIYSADPNIKANDLVTLTDPKGLFLASHVVPLAGAGVSDDAAAVINTVQGALSTADLVSMNAQSQNDQLAAPVIATQWLDEKALF